MNSYVRLAFGNVLGLKCVVNVLVTDPKYTYCGCMVERVGRNLLGIQCFYIWGLWKRFSNTPHAVTHNPSGCHTMSNEVEFSVVTTTKCTMEHTSHRQESSSSGKHRIPQEEWQTPQSFQALEMTRMKGTWCVCAIDA